MWGQQAPSCLPGHPSRYLGRHGRVVNGMDTEYSTWVPCDGDVMHTSSALAPPSNRCTTGRDLRGLVADSAPDGVKECAWRKVAMRPTLAESLACS